MNSQYCLKAFHALGKSPLDQSIFGVLPAEEFPSIFFVISLKLYTDSLELRDFHLGVNSSYSDTMLCTQQRLRHVVTTLCFYYPSCLSIHDDAYMTAITDKALVIFRISLSVI